MVDTAKVALKIARLSGRFRGNPRLCYRWLVERLAPDIEEALDLLGRCHPFIISSTGRTGTTWLAELLNQIQGTYVVHEPVPDEQYYHVEAFMRPERALPYLQEFRLREMAFRIRALRPAVYGEVNGALRRHVGALRELVPDFRIVHLVRDGRDVVTSVMNTETYTPHDKTYADFHPPTDTIDLARWQSMDRFSKACWLWACENAHLRKYASHRARFEDITAGYDLFKKQILDPLDLNFEESVWATHNSKPLNATQVTRHPGYEGWTDAQKDTFWCLCENEMTVHGYLQ